MLIREYEEAGLFLKDYEEHLLKKEAVSQLLLYPAYNSLSSADRGRELYGAVLEELEPVLLFCNKSGHNLILLSLLEEKAVVAAAVLADFFISRHRTINGITGRQILCQSFIEQYKKQVDCTFLQTQETELMEIRQVNEIKPALGQQRLAVSAEAKLAADWMLRFQMEAKMSELDYEVALSKANKMIEVEKLYFYENEEGTVVSMAAVCKKLLHGMMITYIYTPEEYRGKGYAAANIYCLSKLLLGRGYDFCALLSDIKNPLSNRAYEKVGYQTLEDVYEYMLLLP